NGRPASGRPCRTGTDPDVGPCAETWALRPCAWRPRQQALWLCRTSCDTPVKKNTGDLVGRQVQDFGESLNLPYRESLTLFIVDLPVQGAAVNTKFLGDLPYRQA